MSYVTTILLMFAWLALTSPRAFGQAAVEYGLGAGRAATTTAPALNLGNNIKGVFDTLNKTIEPDRGGTASGSSAARSSSPSRRSAGLAGKKATLGATQSATQPAKVYEDPLQIQAGIEYDEMVRRFGPPSMSITTEAGKRAFSYPSRDGLVQVEVEGGKVVSLAGQRSK